MMSVMLAVLWSLGSAGPPATAGETGAMAKTRQQTGQMQPGTTQPADEAVRYAAGFLMRSVEAGEQKLPYCVYVPPEYDPQRPWPVILFLHGSGERGTDGLLQTEVGIGTAIRRNRARFPAIVVMPQCPPGKLWWQDEMLQFALRCVEQTSREYHLDPDRVYLTGLSLGGAGAWHLGARLKGQFAAIVPICGFAELGPATGVAETLAASLAGVPIWCFHGQADENVPAAKSREMVAAIQAAGGQVRYTEIPGAGHVIWDQVYGDAELVRWLFAQKRGTTSRPDETGGAAP